MERPDAARRRHCLSIRRLGSVAMAGTVRKRSHQAAGNAARRGGKSARGSIRPGRAARAAKAGIDLYYWPTPNGFKISIMLEECGLPYRMIPVNIAKGDQFKAQFLAISPNNRMPAIVDHDGPGGRPISIFESGAILQYLGRKTGRFYPQDERGRVEVEQWLFWQMANLGPKAGEAHHFRHYAAQNQQYAIDRFTNEMNRIYGVMNRRLKDRDFLAGRYSIADMACVGWVSRYERQGQDMNDFPNLKRWLETMRARPAVDRGMHLRVEEASQVNMQDPQVRALLFDQRARS
jgi:GST-like protein